MNIFTRKIYLTLLILVSALSAKGVTADFTADVTRGCAPLVVHFTNTSSGASSYHWDLGNGTISTLINVSGTYLTAGTYTVTLVATGASGSSTKTMIITVLPAPTVSFNANDTEVCPGTNVVFTSTSAPGVPGPVTYSWSFGDGGTGVGSPVTYAYATPGTYNVTLYAINSSGCTASLTKTGYMHVFTPATPAFTASATTFCHPIAHVAFTNSSTGTAPLSYTWAFGDGTTSTSPSPAHDYSTSGTFTVRLRVTDGNGCTDSLVAVSYIHVGNIHAAFTFPSPACSNSPVLFTNTSTPYLTDSWDFGDGSTSAAGSPTHTYPTAGTYTVTLIIFDGTCYDTVTHTITILPGPVASFTYLPAGPCPPPVPVTFTGSVPPGATVSWLYGDGGTGSGATSTHTYTSTGSDSVRMIVVDPSTGCRDTILQILPINGLKVTITDTPNNGCIPLTVHFSAQATVPVPFSVYPYPITAYSWTFGDGSPTSTSPAPVHTYTTVGSFRVILNIVTANGCNAADTVTITTGTPPVVTFSVTPAHVCYNQPVGFYPIIISGPVDSFAWSFGDGPIIPGRPPGSTGHTYGMPGTFTPTLTPYYHGCAGPPYVLPYPIIIDSPKAIISDSILCSPHNRVAFFDKSVGDDSHVWMFGDGTTSTLSNPVHDYPSLTVFTVKLATYNSRSGCRDTATFIVDLTPPLFSFSATRTGICKDAIDTFTAVVTSGTVSGYRWSSAGYSTDSTSSIYIDSFHVPGLYTIRLIVSDQHQCKDTLTRVSYITVAQPVANFTVSPATGCAPLSVVFSDASTDIPGTTFTNFYWAFGDGLTTSVGTPSVTHVFTSAGTFTTKEIVTDNFGCKDSVTLPLVTTYRPTASFSASTPYPCINDSVHFTNTSPGVISSVLWMFGDGTTSTAAAPRHPYTALGVYTVKLVVTDAHGCTDTAVSVGLINVTKPTAAFTMSDTFTICPPKMVAFTNTSIGASRYAWDLGDGNTSALLNPSDMYFAPSYYTIRLIATSVWGCHDTAYSHFNLYGYAGAFGYSPLTGCTPLTVYFHANTRNVANIIWDFADGVTSTASHSDSTTHTYTVPGAYVPKLVLSDNTGCQNSSMGLDTIKVDAVIAGFTSRPNPVCQADTFYFQDTSKGYWAPATSWYWTFANGDTSTIPAPVYYYASAGTYPVKLSVADAWGCSTTLTSNITIYPPPVITTDPDTVICVSDAATLTAYGAVSYTWSPPATISCTNCNPTLASPMVVTNYTVTGTDEHGCVNTDTVSVYLKTKTISTGSGDAEICRGIIVQLHDSGATKFTWIPAAGLNNAHIAEPFANPDTTTTYMVIAQLASCIPDTNYVTVIVHPVPTVNAGPDEYIVEGSSVPLRAVGINIDNYLWSHANSLSCDACSNPVASPTVTTSYVVYASTNYGCKTTDTVEVHIYCAKSQVFLPNSFTPNGDGQNDVFYPRGTGVSRVKSFRIYNRWGQLLFERDGIALNDPSAAWDGTYNGDMPKPDVYVYVLDAICETGEPLFLKGDVTIIR